jgi:hypothetical protein
MSQIFKSVLPRDIILEFFSNHCISAKNCYVFNKDTFKKFCYHPQNVESFYLTLKPYYFSSKLKYLNNITFNGLTTVLRQICNFLEIPFTSKIKYSHSTYSIEYYFMKKGILSD